jgi:hypothetical protein
MNFAPNHITKLEAQSWKQICDRRLWRMQELRLGRAIVLLIPLLLACALLSSLAAAQSK